MANQEQLALVKATLIDEMGSLMSEVTALQQEVLGSVHEIRGEMTQMKSSMHHQRLAALEGRGNERRTGSIV